MRLFAKRLILQSTYPLTGTFSRYFGGIEDLSPPSWGAPTAGSPFQTCVFLSYFFFKFCTTIMSGSEELTLIHHQNLFFVFLRDQMPKFSTKLFIRGLRYSTGPYVHLYLQNPVIPSPERCIKCGDPRLLFTQSDHLVKK